MAIRRAYGLAPRSEHHGPSDLAVAALAAATAAGVAVGPRLGSGLDFVGLAGDATARSGAVAVAVVGVVLAWRSPKRGALIAVGVLLACAGAWRSDAAWDAVVPDQTGSYLGWALVVDDPQPYGAATRVVFELDGERFESWQRSRSTRLRAEQWRAGDRVMVSGIRDELADDRVDRVVWQHVVGAFAIDWAGDVVSGRPVDRASNRVRAAVERAGGFLPDDDGSLFRGLVVGDDRDQPRAMIDRFRNSGLSHLTAVSGQNVAFVLAAAGPILVRLRPGWRWVVTVGLIAWFASLTRFEPSIVRAGTMAVLSATGFVLGRQRSAFRLLGWATAGLLLVDPLLAWSVGFWLSVGATCGVTSVGPWLAERLGLLGPFALPVGITLGAQVGVVVPAVLVFGRLPVMSIPANLLAVPVAGFVMLYGLPAGLLAGWVGVTGPFVMFPCRVGVRWVDTVAVLADRLEPDRPGSVVAGWCIVVALTVTVAVGGRVRAARTEDASSDRSARG